MANATDIARIGTLPDGAFLPDGTGDTNVKSLKGMTEQSIKDSIGNPIGGAFGFAKDGLIGLLGNLVGDLLGTVGDILKGGLKMGAVIVGGVIEVGSAIIGGAINAVGDLFGWVGSGIISLFNRKAPTKPLPPVFSEIRVDLETEIAPFLESVDQGQENARLALEEADALKIELGEEMARVDSDIALANSLIAAVGDVDQKIADQAAIHIRDAEAALGEAKAAQQALTAYKELVDPKIQSALTDSKAGLERLGTLEPKVSTVISDLAAYEEATNTQIQDLLGKANGAITDAGQALTQYDDLLSEYEGFKTEASGSLEALRKSSTTQGQKIGTIEGDLPGIKTSITNVFALAETVQSTANQAKAAADVAVTNTVVEYAVGTSETTAPTTGWSTSTPTRTPGSFVWMRSRITYGSGTTKVTSPVLLTGNTGAQGTPGGKGADGLPGKDGVGVKTTVINYALSTSGTTAPTSGWTATVPTLTKGRYLWTRTLWTYTDSSTETGHSVSYIPTNGSNGTDGLPGKDGVGITGTAITYAKSSSGTSAPTTGWVAQPPATSPGDFMWTKTVWTYSDNTTETGYTVGKIGNTGAKGDQGIQGVPGAKGADGQTTYTWIKYADSASGAGLSDSPVGKTYIGFAYNQTTATESTVASHYTWSLIQGPQGNQGVPGAKGADGQTTYTWIKYSDSASGTSPYDVPKASTKYIGIAVNKTTATESTNPADYTWSLFKGEDGKGISTTAVTYAVSTSGTTTPTSWSSTIPTVPEGRFLWTRTVTTYTDATTSTAYSVARQGVNGANGTAGAKGADGLTSYFHTAYATNATGTTGFSTTDANGKTYVGTYSDFTEADSTDPSKYTWQLVKGADGTDGKGVKTSVVTYAASTNGTTAPASGWVSTIPTVAQGSYLWTRTVTTFTDGATTTVTAPSRQGVDGGKGDQGVSVTSVVPHYQLVAKGATAPAKPTTASPSGWTTTEPGYIADRELFRADKVTYSNGAFTWTDVSRVSAYTAASQANDKLPGMQEAITGAHGKAEEAQRNLDNLRIGGRNLRKNSNSFSDYGTYMGSVRNEIEEGVSVAEWGATDATRMKYTRGNNNLVFTPGVNYLNSETVTFSFWLKNVGNAPIRAVYNGLTPSDGGTYEPGFSGRVTHTGKLRRDYDWFQHQFYFLPDAVDTGNTTMEFILWRSKLEVGTKATDWTPAPEDTEAEIAAAVQTSADALNTYRTSNDKAVSDANAAAAAAAGVAQAKGEVIYQATAPTGARATKANLWIRTSDNKPHTYNGTKWVEVTDKVAADAAAQAATALSTAQAKTTTYYGSTAPSGTKTAGDLWLDSGSDNALKRWSGSAWVEVRDGQLAKALKAAGDAQSTADGKVRSFAQSTAPTGMTATDVGDIWLDTDDGNKMYRWSGSKWVTMQDHLAVQAKSVADTATTKAEAAQSTVDNLQIGGRNLAFGTAEEQVKNVSIFMIPVNVSAVQGAVGKVLTLSFDARSDVEVYSGDIYIRNDAASRSISSFGNFSITSEKQRYEFQVTLASAALDTDRISLAIRATGAGTMWISNLQLERGNKATDWSPAPEDTEAEIQAQASALAGYQLSNDAAVDAAKAAAQAAAGLAGEKGEVIYSTTTPPADKRKAANLWIKGPANTPHVWNGSAWVEITDQAAKDAAKAAADANTLAKSKTTTYYQTTAPAASVSVVGDLWIDQSTAGKNTLKRWSGSAWVVVQDKAIQDALTNAATAQSTADGKVRTFSQTTAPTGLVSKDVGDLWIDTDDGNKLYRWSGTTWVGVQDAAIAAAQKAADDAAKANKILDTRNANEPPSFYWSNYNQTTVREFKFLATVGAGTTGYGVLTTVVPWTDHSGGAITQEFNVNNSDTVLYRRSSGSGATATWTVWKDRAKDLADSITRLGNDLVAKTGPNSDLQKNINALDEATGKQYEDLNKQLWGDQGELNKLNSLLWDDQGKLNQATEIFKSNITGWQTDVYNAFVDFDKVNQYQDGLIAANNRAIKANTEAVSAHQRILQVAYPDSGSAIPMVPGGVNVGTADNPVYEAMPEWLNAYGVTKVTGVAGMDDKRAAHSTTAKTVTVTSATKVKVNPTALYRYSFWIQASAAGSGAFIRLYSQNSTGAVLENIPDAGVPTPRTSGNHLFWFNGNVPTSWTKISGTIRLKPDVTHVYIQSISLNYQGTVASQWLADIQLEPIIPSQSEVNRALSEVNDAQTAILSGHQDVLDMAFPNTSLVPMTNGVPEWTSTVAANPIRTPEGNWRFTSATAIQPGTGGKHVPTVNGVIYRAMVRLRRTGSGGTFSIRLRGAGSTVSITNFTAVTGKPAPAGASRTNFLTASPTVGTEWTTWYYDFTLLDNTGDVRIGYVLGSTGVEVSQLSVVALLPSQVEVDAAQNEAIEANTKAISLAFPDRNLDPQTSAGHPEWSTPSTVTIDTTGSFGGYTPTYRLAGSTTGGFMDFQADIREYRFRARISPGSGSSVSLNVSMTNPSGQNMVEAWRVTFPPVDSREEYLSEAGEMSWTAGTTVTATLANGLVGQPGEWGEIDVVIRLKAGENRGRLQLSAPTTTGNWVLLHKPRLTMFSASQWQVDYAQNKALDGLSRAIELQGDIDDRIKAAVGEDGLGGVVEDLKLLIDELRTFIPRTMFMDLGSATPIYNNDHFKVDSNDGNVVVRATGQWTGRMAITYGFGAKHETYIREYPIPFPNGDRFEVVTSQTRANRQFARIDYWIDKGEQGLSTKKEVVNASVGTDWTTRSALTFTVEDSVSHQIRYDVVWPQTSQNNKSWGLRIKRNGLVLKELTQKNIGPTWPWEDGRRSQEIAWKGGLTKGDTITFEVYTGSNNTSDQRKLESAERLISWIRKTS